MYAKAVQKQPRRPVSGGPGCEETTKIIGRDAEYSPETGYGKDLADACRAVAESTEIPLPGLHAGSVRFFLEQGEKAARRFFHPGDRTHFSDYGGYLVVTAL